MEYENMRVSELKAPERQRGLRGYSRLRKAELIALLRDSQPRRPPQSVSGRAEPGPSLQEMDIFEQ